MASKCFGGCTIEAEPRTLTGGVLVCAREAAKDVVDKKESEEASIIFTEGMRPVVSIKTMEKQIERRNQLHGLSGINITATEVRVWNPPSPPPVFEEFHEQAKITEPLSSPF